MSDTTTYYAYYDPNTTVVMAWYTSAEHPTLTGLSVLEITETQWNARMTNPSTWAVVNGALVPYIPPSPVFTLAENATAMLAAGMQIVSTGDSALNGTYPCGQPATMNEMGMLSALNAGLTLPGDVATIVDKSGNPHFFSSDQFKSYCQAKINFTQTLQTIIGSNSGTLPTLPITIP